jgi:hypothetical protein
MKWFLLLFILISCGRKVVEESNFPDNQASAVEKEVLDEVLSTIQADFDALGVRVDVRDTRYSVADTDNALGICFKSASGERRGIALHHKVFAEMIETKDTYGLIYKVLLHEIGHCFFDREHDETYFSEPGYVMLIEMREGSIERHSTLPVTLMSELGWYRVPKTLWPYYVKEIAGIDRIVEWEDIEPYANITLEETLVVPETAEN